MGSDNYIWRDSYFTPQEMYFLSRSGNIKDLRKIRDLFPSLSVQDHLWRMNAAHVRFPNQENNNGLEVIQNFLTKDEHQFVIDGFRDLVGTLNKQPRTMFKCDRILNKIADAVREMTGLADLENQMVDNTFYQKVVNSPQDNDVQKVFHMDTFFPAWKFWYFPMQSNGLKTGNFRYVRNSHLYDKKRVDFCSDILNQFYFGDADALDKDTLEGSFRITDEQIEEMYPGERVELVVPANTLVIANVFGFHSRGETQYETSRIALHGSIRFDEPFKDRRN